MRRRSECHSDLRLRAVGFLVLSAQELGVRPIVKYTALSLFADRFYPSLRRSRQENDKRYWLLQPIRESSLQLFALISVWISSKMHDSCPLSVKSLKCFGDKTIREQHFTARDFLEAEVTFLKVNLRNYRRFINYSDFNETALFLKVMDYEIGASNIAFRFLEELLLQLKADAKVGELVSFEACLDIMDILYDKEETSLLYSSPLALAASTLVASYVITVPQQRWEFPVISWVKFVTLCNEEKIANLARDIIKHVFEP